MTDPFRPGSSFPAYEAPKPDPEQLISGTANEIIDWVGTSKSRAKKALHAETISKSPRVTLVAKLEKLI